MTRRAVGLMLLALVAAACSSHHPAAKRPPVPTTAGYAVGALRDYATTVATVSGPVAKANQELAGCVSPSAQCQAGAVTARKAAVYVVDGFGSDDSAREGGAVTAVPPGISPLVVRTETDARAVKRDAASVTPHADKAAMVALTSRLSLLAEDLGSWQPSGLAGKALASLHIRVAAPAP